MSRHINRLALVVAGILRAAAAAAEPASCDEAQVHAGSCDGLRGAMVDHGATFTASPGPNTEARTPLDGLEGPSHVSSLDLQAMRASAATLPATQASRTETLSDAD